MAQGTEGLLFHQMPLACRRAIAPFSGTDVDNAVKHAWDKCPDAIALLWLAAIRAPHQDGGPRKVREEIARAKGRVMEPINEPSTDFARIAQARLVEHLEQAGTFLDSQGDQEGRLAEWNRSLEQDTPRELYIEYARLMADVVGGIRTNLRALTVE
jgi:hypothetical protein